MDVPALIVALIVGAIAGWLAGLLVHGAGFGLGGDTLISITGAVVAAGKQDLRKGVGPSPF